MRSVDTNNLISLPMSEEGNVHESSFTYWGTRYCVESIDALRKPRK